MYSGYDGNMSRYVLRMFDCWKSMQLMFVIGMLWHFARQPKKVILFTKNSTRTWFFRVVDCRFQKTAFLPAPIGRLKSLCVLPSAHSSKPPASKMRFGCASKGATNTWAMIVERKLKRIEFSCFLIVLSSSPWTLPIQRIHPVFRISDCWSSPERLLFADRRFL